MKTQTDSHYLLSSPTWPVLSRRKTLGNLILSLAAARQGRERTLTFPLMVTAANTVEEYGAQATSPTAEFRS